MMGIPSGCTQQGCLDNETPMWATDQNTRGGETASTEAQERQSEKVPRTAKNSFWFDTVHFKHPATATTNQQQHRPTSSSQTRARLLARLRAEESFPKPLRPLSPTTPRRLSAPRLLVRVHRCSSSLFAPVRGYWFPVELTGLGDLIWLV
jgi:hypothetical protein